MKTLEGKFSSIEEEVVEILVPANRELCKTAAHEDFDTVLKKDLRDSDQVLKQEVKEKIDVLQETNYPIPSPAS